MIVTALMIGGISIFTFIVTPAVFRAFNRDTASEIVGSMFSGYFTYNFALSIAMLFLFIALRPDRSILSSKLSLALIVIAVVICAYVLFKLYPDITEIKKTIASFQSVPVESAERQAFRRLHAISAVLNLALLADAVAVFVMGLRIR